MVYKLKLNDNIRDFDQNGIILFGIYQIGIYFKLTSNRGKL